MKSTNNFIKTTFGALLASQVASVSLAESTQKLSEPFQIDISQILNGTQGHIVKVENPKELAEKYSSGSSVIVEGDFGLSEALLAKLQEDINTKYAHLNILVYLAEDGKSFSEYGGKRLSKEDKCGTNPGLAYLRDSYYSGVDKAAKGKHIIFYLAAKEAGYDYNMVCTLISPQMSELIGSDAQIFIKGAPLFESVFQELKQDFNKLGAIYAFLEGVDKKVLDASIRIEKERQNHINEVKNIKSKITVLQEKMNQITNSGFLIKESRDYKDFDISIFDANNILLGDSSYISEEEKTIAINSIENASSSLRNITEAIRKYSAYGKRISEISHYLDIFEKGEYADILIDDIGKIRILLSEAQIVWDSKNIEYIGKIQIVESKFSLLENKIQTKELIQDAILVGKGATGVGLGALLAYFNRRKKRVSSKEQFLSEFEKLEVGLKEIKRVFKNDIEGNTQSIEMFFGNQEGVTGEKIQELKIHVAYISVLIPKIEEILQKAKSTAGFSPLRAEPFIKAYLMLGDDILHSIDPSKSDVDKKLLEKINGGNIQDLSTLIKSMNKTLPDFVKMLDENISKTKNIFDELTEASTQKDIFLGEIQENIKMIGTLFGEFTSRLGDEHFGFFIDIGHDLLKQGENETQNEADIMKAYGDIKIKNSFIKTFLGELTSLIQYIDTEHPSESRKNLEIAGYKTGIFIDTIQALYLNFGKSFITSLETKRYTVSNISEIFAYYEQMKHLAKAHFKMVAEKERKEALEIGILKTSKNFSKILENNFSGSLFEEEGNNLRFIIQEAEEKIALIQNCIQEMNDISAYSIITEIKESLGVGHSILAKSDFVISNYTQNIGTIQTGIGEISPVVGNIGKKLTQLSEEFGTSIHKLQKNDFVGDISDKDISNNDQEVKNLLIQISRIFIDAQTAFQQGKFLLCQKFLDEVYNFLKQATQKIQEVEFVYTHAYANQIENNNLYLKNSEALEQLKIQLETQHRSTTTQTAIGILEKKYKQIDMKGKYNPHDITNILNDISQEILRLGGEGERDENEFSEYRKYIRSSITLLENLKNLRKKSITSNVPQSRETQDFLKNFEIFQEELESFKQYEGEKIADWYNITHRLEILINLGTHAIGLFNGDTEFNNIFSEGYTTASEEVKKAKAWSGIYTSISSDNGEREIRKAHDAYIVGNFTEARAFLIASKNKALKALSDATNNEIKIKRQKDQDAADKRRRDDQDAAERRRRDDASSSSSYSGGSSGGFSGFSGGGDF